MRGRSLRALAVHTEKIHDNAVWARLRPLLQWMERRGHRATFFVYPFRATVVGREELALERVRVLAELGHEIAQHTHFYLGTATEKPEKVTDLSPENVRRCIKRDFEWLTQIARPRGFTSGAWAVTETLYPTLVELGFEYDCSARHPSLGIDGSPNRLWLREPESRSLEGGTLVLLPTTHTLRSIFRPWSNRIDSSRFRYRVLYFHDYDLLRPRVWMAVVCVLGLGGPWVTCQEVAAAFRRLEVG